MQSNRDQRIETLHQEAATHYLQGDFNDALRVWRELLEMDDEDERAQEGVRLCEMLAADGVSADGSAPPPAGPPRDSQFDEVQAELDDLERLLDNQLGGGLSGDPVPPGAPPAAPRDLGATLDADEAVAASRAAAAELRRRVVELMAEGRSARDAGDPDTAIGILRRVLILDDAHAEARTLLEQLERSPMAEPTGEADDDETPTEPLPSDPVHQSAPAPGAPGPEVAPADAPAAGPVEGTRDDEDCEDLLGHVDFGLEGASSAGPIGQAGDMPEGVERVRLAASPDAGSARDAEAVPPPGSAPVDPAFAEPVDAPGDTEGSATGEHAWDQEMDGEDAETRAERHAALNRAAERLARLHADEAATVSVRRLSRGLILGGVGLVLVVGLGLGASMLLGAFTGPEEPLLPPPPPVPQGKAHGKGGAGKGQAGAAADGATEVEAGAPATPVPDAQIASWMQTAAEAVRAGDYQAAIPVLHRVLEARPEHPEALAAMRFAVERYQAEATLVRKEKEAYDAFARGDYRSALRAFYRLPEETGRNYDRQIANGWYNLAVQALQGGNCASAAEPLNELRQIAPDDPGLRAAWPLARSCTSAAGTEDYLRGTALLKLRRVDQ